MDHDVEERVASFFASRPDGVAAVYLFGSVARSMVRAGSDVDVGVLFVTPPERTLEAQPYALDEALERELGRPVDVVALNDVPVDLAIRVLREGRLIFEADRSARIRFEVRTRNEAFDLEPILRRYRAPRQESA